MNKDESYSCSDVLISFQDVGVSYPKSRRMFSSKRFWALKKVSFQLYRGETLGVIGKNGVGKSTLLRLLAGIISPSSGRMINHGVSVSLLSLQAGFIPYLTGKENAILSGMLLGSSRKQMLACLEEIREYADIGEFFNQPVSIYSSGMRARLGFSVAVSVSPDVILLDEVLGVGDGEFRKKSSQTMKAIVCSDKSVVLVSHNPRLVSELCDRVVWIEDGEVRAVGCSSDIVSSYIEHLGE